MSITVKKYAKKKDCRDEAISTNVPHPNTQRSKHLKQRQDKDGGRQQDYSSSFRVRNIECINKLAWRDRAGKRRATSRNDVQHRQGVDGHLKLNISQYSFDTITTNGTTVPRSLESPERSPFVLYPSSTPCEYFTDRIDQNSPTPPGTLPADANLSSAATDLLKRLLQPDPKLRLRSILALQTLAFYMGRDVQSYMYKKDSPFKLLGRSKERPKNNLSKERMLYEFADFDSFVARDHKRTG
ncbi:hypothetical protein KPH14_009157 [Odynerus spinipes]|uniref:Uncharacterized protein n=1 Tax=Odynerus spinipes TaxID=1348599 RepID=A0AAD9RPW7_9HYME|nr:hypothetical protein KPH14_009157 [Odynerus spinipes]